MIPDIRAPLEMLAHQGLHRRRAEELPVRCRAPRQGVLQDLPQRSAQPFVRRKVEAHFLPPQHPFRQLAPHQMFQHHLLLCAAHLEFRRQRGREFHNG